MLHPPEKTITNRNLGYPDRGISSTTRGKEIRSHTRVVSTAVCREGSLAHFSFRMASGDTASVLSILYRRPPIAQGQRTPTAVYGTVLILALRFSGHGLTGGVGRCYNFFMDFSECMAKAGDPVE